MRRVREFDEDGFGRKAKLRGGGEQRACGYNVFYGCHARESEFANVPDWVVLAGCSARRDERRVASHTSEEQRRNAPASAARNGTLAVSASLSVQPIALWKYPRRRDASPTMVTCRAAFVCVRSIVLPQNQYRPPW